MRKLPIYLLLMILSSVSACSLNNDDDDTTASDWRKANGEWYEAQKALTNPDGSPFFETVVPAWNPSSSVLMHWFNDRALTSGNLRPMATSTVDVKYMLKLYNGAPTDSSYTLTANGDSIFRTKVSGVISGWQIALQYMNVGDSVRVVIPYTEGYGVTGSGKIPAYSALQFDIKLVDIPYYEIPVR